MSTQAECPGCGAALVGEHCPNGATHWHIAAANGWAKYLFEAPKA